MAKKFSKAVGVGIAAGGLLLIAPAGIASADVVGAVNDAVQNVVEQNNEGLQGVTAINNDGLQSVVGLNNDGLQNGVASLNDAAKAGVSTTQSTITTANGFVKFAVQGLLGKK